MRWHLTQIFGTSHVIVCLRTSEAYLCLLRLEAGALVVLERGHRLGELQEDLAPHAPPPHALAARRAAVAPVRHDETENG